MLRKKLFWFKWQLHDLISIKNDAQSYIYHWEIMYSYGDNQGRRYVLAFLVFYVKNGIYNQSIYHF